MSFPITNRLFQLSKSARACSLLLRGTHSSFYPPPPEPIEPSTISREDLEKHRCKQIKDYDSKSSDLATDIQVDAAERLARIRKDADKIVNFKQDFPEFLPEPNLQRRDKLMEIIEREDMLRRRKVVDIPLFFVGSIVAVTVADKFGKESRFLGICIQREGHGLRHTFTLRNVIDQQGIEVRYDMYSPLVQKIEVIRLEKRLDDNLQYLRDAPLEYSYFPQDMKKDLILTKEGSEVPVNPLKVKLNSHPWSQRYERMNLRGVQYPLQFRTERARKKLMRKKNLPDVSREWEKVDLMKHYRESINPVESKEIMQRTQKSMSAIAKERQKKKQQEEEEMRKQKSRKGIV